LVFFFFSFSFFSVFDRSQCPVSNQRNQTTCHGWRGGCKRVRVRSLNEVIGVVRIGLKSLGFFLHAFLDFQDGRRLRLILQTKNKREWLSTDALFFFSFSFIFYLLSLFFSFLFFFLNFFWPGCLYSIWLIFVFYLFLFWFWFLQLALLCMLHLLD